MKRCRSSSVLPRRFSSTLIEGISNASICRVSAVLRRICLNASSIDCHAAADAVEIWVDVDQPVALAVFFEAGDFLCEVAVRIDDDNRGRPRFTEVAIDQQLQELALTAAALAQNVSVALPVTFRHQHRQACKKKQARSAPAPQ